MSSLRISDLDSHHRESDDGFMGFCKGCQSWLDRQIGGDENAEPNKATSELIERFKQSRATHCSSDNGGSPTRLISRETDDEGNDLGTTLMNDYTLTEDNREYAIAFNKGAIGIQFETELFTLNICVRKIEAGTQAAQLRNVIHRGDILVGVNGRSL